MYISDNTANSVFSLSTVHSSISLITCEIFYLIALDIL